MKFSAGAFVLFMGAASAFAPSGFVVSRVSDLKNIIKSIEIYTKMTVMGMQYMTNLQFESR
jgi:hypothetical protein